MDIQMLQTGPIGTNTYVVYGGLKGECAVIDPADAGPVLSFCERNGLRCTGILITHGHFDHIMGVAKLREATGAKVYMSAIDSGNLTQESGSGKKSFSWGYKIEPCAVDRMLEDGDTVETAGFSFKVIATPGHTPGGVCYVMEEPEKLIFAGDTLFHENVGRVDLPGGSAYELHASITKKLFTLPGDYAVYSGHSEETSLEHERKFNPYVTRWSPEEW